MADAVFQKDDGTWWHCDETWADALGPFPSRGLAETSLREYLHYLTVGPHAMRHSTIPDSVRREIRWESDSGDN